MDFGVSNEKTDRSTGRADQDMQALAVIGLARLPVGQSWPKVIAPLVSAEYYHLFPLTPHLAYLIIFLRHKR
jgi:hypothetical protein